MIGTPYVEETMSTGSIATATPLLERADRPSDLGKPPGHAQGPLEHDSYGPQCRADVDVQRTGSAPDRPLSPQGFREISRAQLIEPTTGQLGKRNGVCWSHPAFAYRHVFARNDEALVCANLSEGAN